MRNRREEIKAKGFNLVQRQLPEDLQEGYSGYHQIANYSKLKVGTQTLEDAILDIGMLRKVNPRLANKQTVIKAIDNYDLKTMREISDFFYKTSDIYSRILRYMAFMYRYDWFVTPYLNSNSSNTDKAKTEFFKCLTTLDKFGVKKTLGEIALHVLRYGAYYCYKVEASNGQIVLQELPQDYCRSRFKYGDKPAVEFNMKYFDDAFSDTTQRAKILKMFPEEFHAGYRLYKQNKLPPQFNGDSSGWYLLNPKMTEKFTVNGEDYPAFISVIPLILDLDEAQELDRKKTKQRLLKILIQKMPLDKNGDLIFDVEEAQELHNNAVQMLSRAIGIDVLTTFADVEVANMSDTSATSAQSDDLERIERQLFNEAGVSQMQFNTDGNVALEKSILNDEASMYNLLLQFEAFLNELIEKYNTHPKQIEFKVQLLTTTIYNYKEIAKLYKEQAQLGYSKVLPQVALGQSQSSVLATAHFENDVLDLVNVFIPPISSNNMNADMINRKGGSSSDSAGRPTNEEQGKPVSEKTIQNKEAQS